MFKLSSASFLFSCSPLTKDQSSFNDIKSKLRVLFAFLIMSISISFSGCTSFIHTHDEIKQSDVKELRLNFYQLQHIPNELVGKQFLEIMTVTNPDQRKLITQIEITQETIKIAGMTPNGLPIIQAQWHQGKGLIDQNSRYFDEAMVLGIIRDIQLVKWPLINIESGLMQGVSINERTDVLADNKGHSQIREISYNEQLIMSTVYSLNSVKLTNIINGYAITLENLNDPNGDPE